MRAAARGSRLLDLACSQASGNAASQLHALAAAKPAAARSASSASGASVIAAAAAAAGSLHGALHRGASSSAATAAAAAAATAEATAAASLAADLHRARRLSIPAGLAAGVVGSVAGSGGAAVIVPLLAKACASVPQRLLAGTSTAAVLATASVATAVFGTHGCIDASAALLITVPAVLAAPLGAQFTSRLDCNALKRVLGYFMLAAAPLIPLKTYLFQARKAEAEAAAATGAAGSAGDGGAAASGEPAATPLPLLQQQAASSAAPAAGGDDGWRSRLLRGMPPPPVAATLAATGGIAGFAGGLLGIGPATLSELAVLQRLSCAVASSIGPSLFFEPNRHKPTPMPPRCRPRLLQSSPWPRCASRPGARPRCWARCWLPWCPPLQRAWRSTGGWATSTGAWRPGWRSAASQAAGSAARRRRTLLRAGWRAPLPSLWSFWRGVCCAACSRAAE